MIKTILVLEDEPEIIENLKFDLKGFAENLILSSSGIEALKILKDREVDCIISDIQMPKMDGLEFIRKTRELGITRPVIFLTGQNGLYLIDKFSELGLDTDSLEIKEFLFKPYKVEVLKDTITKVVNLNKS